jgi:phosphate transport system substrate-binding protein
MKLLITLITLTVSAQAFAVDLTGAGSTFVYPVISKWADSYKKENNVSMNYQSIGSGGGIKQIEAKTVDFGASDMPLKPEELAKENLVQFPLVNGGVVPVVNLPGITADQLKLSGDVLADLFLGKITKWNDPKIVALNKGVKLPDTEVTIVHRADGSGTTFIWTNYLTKVSADWKAKAGEGTAVSWPVGVGGKGNEGVASFVKQTAGSIGYVEYAYALQNKLVTTELKNSAGKFVKPNLDSFQAASASADWAKADHFYLVLTDAPGKASWPIAGTTFVLMQKTQAKPEQGKEAVKFFGWAFHKGESQAKELQYVPLPASVVKLVEKTWTESKF